jgi:type IV pilus assembly protein PilY1
MLGLGGKGLFALDITDPAVPKALWEFTSSTDTDLGYTLGNAVITKRHADGKWVVAFASGYNNGPGNSGNDARLYVVDAITGAKYGGTVGEIVATETTQDFDRTGIARITAHVESSRTNNSARYFYAGNLAGTIFRFDIDSGVSQILGHTSNSAGQLPITIRPEVATVTTATDSFRVVYIGTGRYLGPADLDTTAPSATQSQAIFAFKDTGTDLGSLQSAAAGLVQQTLDTSTTPSTIPNPQAVDWSAKNGWYVKLPVGERINVDLKLQVGSLLAVTNKPIDDYCYSGGSSTQYVLGYRDGTAITSQVQKNVGTPIGSSLSTGVAVIKLPTGKVVSIITEADTTVAAAALPVDASMGLSLRRVSWKELL